MAGTDAINKAMMTAAFTRRERAHAASRLVPTSSAKTMAIHRACKTASSGSTVIAERATKAIRLQMAPMSEVTNVVFMGEVPSRRMSRPLDPIPGAGFRKQDRDSSQGCQATQGIAKGQAPRNCQGTGPANCYPDFIAKLPTVKVLAVEYKGSIDPRRMTRGKKNASASWGRNAAAGSATSRW